MCRSGVRSAPDCFRCNLRFYNAAQAGRHAAPDIRRRKGGERLCRPLRAPGVCVNSVGSLPGICLRVRLPAISFFVRRCVTAAFAILVATWRQYLFYAAFVLLLTYCVVDELPCNSIIFSDLFSRRRGATLRVAPFFALSCTFAFLGWARIWNRAEAV